MIKEINGEKYEVPDDIQLNAHKHREKQNWVSLYFYRDRKKTRVQKVECDKIITSKLEYQRNIFYKMSALSDEDQFFDYYFKLKDEIKVKNLVKKNNRYKKNNPKSTKKCSWQEYKAPPHEMDADGKFIVHFR